MVAVNEPSLADARAAVINRFLADLESTVSEFGALPREQREPLLVRDAEKITARVAQVLSRARAQLAALPIPLQRDDSSELSRRVENG
jgi:hypothetical protein